MSALLLAGSTVFTDASTPIRISRQPGTFAQMRRLVMADDPAVLDRLYGLVGFSTYIQALLRRPRNTVQLCRRQLLRQLLISPSIDSL